MTNRWSALRVLRLLALLVQVGLPSFGVVADARLELAAAVQPMHVEAEDHDCHPRGHPPDCAICHYLRGDLVASAERPVVLATAVRTPSPPADAVTPRAGQRLTLPARGPPQLS